MVEVDGSDTTVRKTYSAGSTNLAVRTIVNGTENTLNWMLSDHLGSSSITTTADGTWNSEIRYSAFGETRYSSGITPTDYRYTGQLEQADVNLYYYNARYYDAALGRFIQADTIVPGAGDSMNYDRYAYVKYNPLKFSDPSGKHPCTPGDPDYNPQSCISYMSDSSSGRIETYNRTTVTMSGPLIGHDQHLTTEVPAELLHPNLENGVDPASNACGAVSGCAAAEALEVMGYSECMNKFAELASSYDYSPSSGIQPSDFAAIMTEILKGVANVDVVQAPSPEEGFNTIANALDRGSQVIVDYVGDNYVGDISVADGKPVIYGDDNTFAHFARVYSITDNKITIVNSIFTTSALTVDSPKSEFSQAWNYPERRAGYGVRNPQKVERVNNWIMIISKP